MASRLVSINEGTREEEGATIREHMCDLCSLEEQGVDRFFLHEVQACATEM